MSYSNSIIGIKGNHLNRLNEIFETFNYIDLNNDKRFDSLDELENYLFKNYFDYANRKIALRGIWTDNDWTIICDPEMVDSTDNAMESLSQKLNSEVLTFFIHSASGSFGFAKYKQIKERNFFSTDGIVAVNIGTPLKEEQDLNINERIFTDDILKLANKLGIDLDAKKTKATFLVKELSYTD